MKTNINDYPALLEKTIEAFWGVPKTPVYFANYYDDEFTMRAILFALVLHEINYKSNEYDNELLSELKEFESKSWNSNINKQEAVQILEILAKHKKII